MQEHAVRHMSPPHDSFGESKASNNIQIIKKNASLKFAGMMQSFNVHRVVIPNANVISIALCATSEVSPGSLGSGTF